MKDLRRRVRRAYGLAGFSIGTRVAGGVIAAGYLLGLVPGPVVAVVGGLGLMTFGRALLVGRVEGTLAGAALAITAGSLGVGALRWGTLDLDRIRGVQSVLGPTVLVGPPTAAAATGIAMGAALVALSVWLLVPRPPRRLRPRVGLVLEGALASLAVVTVFAEPVTRPLDLGDLGEASIFLSSWAATVAVTALVVVGLAALLARLGPVWLWAALGSSGLAAVIGAALIPSVL